jgi:hypothetical protein
LANANILLAPPNPMIRAGSQQQLVANIKAIELPTMDCLKFMVLNLKSEPTPNLI